MWMFLKVDKVKEIIQYIWISKALTRGSSYKVITLLVKYTNHIPDHLWIRSLGVRIPDGWSLKPFYLFCPSLFNIGNGNRINRLDPSSQSFWYATCHIRIIQKKSPFTIQWPYLTFVFLKLVTENKFIESIDKHNLGSPVDMQFLILKYIIFDFLWHCVTVKIDPMI